MEVQNSSIPLCAGCKAGESTRPSEFNNGNLTQVNLKEVKTKLKGTPMLGFFGTF